MAVPLKIGVGHLLPELLAHTYIILGSFKLAGAISALSPKSLPELFKQLLIFVEVYLHFCALSVL